MDKELLSTLGTAAVWTAAIFTIADRMLSLNERYRKFKEQRDAQREERAEVEPAPDTEAQAVPGAWSTALAKLGPPLSYLAGRELLVIIGVGILLNYLGLVLSSRPESILYLDMTGTAVAAFLLGPWWGAIVGLLSSCLVNWLLYPDSDAALHAFPWALVNMTGGLLWGWMARGIWFRRYLASGRASGLAHARFLLQFGVVGACAMSVPGALVQASLTDSASLSLAPSVAVAIQHLVAEWRTQFLGALEEMFGAALGERMGQLSLLLVQSCLRYVPDKTMSVAIALAVVKFGFPLFERELIHGTPSGGNPPRDNRLMPLLLGLVYTPVFAILLFADAAGRAFWALWLAPWVVIVAGYFLLRSRCPSDEDIIAARTARASRYDQALRPLESDPTYQFSQRLILATLVASACFMLGLPLVIIDYYNATLTFFGVVYGFLLAVHLVSVAISQNISLGRGEEGEPVPAPEQTLRSGRVRLKQVSSK